MRQATRIVGTAVATAAGMYWLDPVSGRRRRAELGQQLSSAVGDLQRALGVGGRDLAHRTQGVAARTRAAIKREPVLDEVLVERVRSRLGRVVSHPHAIEVSSREGRVSLKGAVLAAEYPGLMRALWSVSGVRAIEDQLSVHDSSGDIPALQGAPARAAGPGELSPGARLLASMAGCVLLVLGVGQRTTIGVLGAIAGGALIVGGASHFSLERLSERLIDTLRQLGDARRGPPRRRRAVRAHLRRAAPTLSPAPGLASDPGQAMR